MLTLLLLRHARAAAQERGDDMGRVLTADGRADAAALGHLLADQGRLPDRAFVSPSTRTRQTLEGVEKGSGRAVPATYDPALYAGTPTQVSAAITALAEDVASVLVIGHNPTIAELASSIAATGDVRGLEAMRARFPPCSLAIFTFDRSNWQDIGGGHLESFITADMLRGRDQAGRQAS